MKNGQNIDDDNLSRNFLTILGPSHKYFRYRWTSLFAVFLSADSLFHKCNISLKGQISSQNVSFYVRIQYSRSKIVGRIYREYRGLPLLIVLTVKYIFYFFKLILSKTIFCDFVIHSPLTCDILIKR